MYRMFSGAPPFAGETYLDTITAHLKKEPQPFSEEIDVPEKLKSLIFRCLSKSPDGRPETMAALADALNTISGEDEIIASGRFPILNLETKQKAEASLQGRFSTKKIVLLSTAVLLLSVSIGSFVLAKFVTQPKTQVRHNHKVSRVTHESIESINPNKFQITKEGRVIQATTLSKDNDFDALQGQTPFLLMLNETDATDDTIKKIRDLKFPLRSLDLSSTKITDSCVHDLNAMSTITELTVPNTNISDSFLQQLHLPLKALNVDECAVGDRGLLAVSDNFPMLTRLETSATKVTINGLRYLPKLTHLRQLYLSNLDIDDRVIEVLKALHLTGLNLTEAQMSKAVLKRLPELKTLKVVKLSHVPRADNEMIQWLREHMPKCVVRSQQQAADEQRSNIGDFVDALDKSQ
jgi:hypothetical protein